MAGFPINTIPSLLTLDSLTSWGFRSFKWVRARIQNCSCFKWLNSGTLLLVNLWCTEQSGKNSWYLQTETSIALNAYHWHHHKHSVNGHLWYIFFISSGNSPRVACFLTFPSLQFLIEVILQKWNSVAADCICGEIIRGRQMTTWIRFSINLSAVFV